ncbi:ankyrin repeat and SOCS box protein 16 [Magnaporthiopsis poae ATCC 64411]|uniref:Ankyrin repeat and SOCS box protein 16 n=1 Tax=Magnaporthiopsis poae (strain ATCC 64411 / 73-15) TaxID=644358 RepID=A0A0C4E1F8_MAGP6|nr:ankyrin repeat and SOCS box protein 16 [Magnaporthiopsis poae ATCC 64411]
MGPDKSRTALLELCTKATLLGNNISVRMLEFLSSVKHQPHGFKNLAQDFLDICRILWAIEAGLTECFRAGQHFPEDMVKELNGKFRQTNADFQVLDHMMFEFLEYENGGVGGKLRKGWRMMFAEKSIAKIRDSLGKSRDSLRMSALVFQWSLGSSSPDGSIGSGYSGLAAALDRMAKGRPPGGTPKTNDYNGTMGGPAPMLGQRIQNDLPKLPALPPTMAPLSQSDDMAMIMRDDIEPPVISRRDSLRSRDRDETRSTRSGRSGGGLRLGTENRGFYSDDRDRDRERERTLLAHRRLDRRDDRDEMPDMPASIPTKISTASYNNSVRRASTSRTPSDSGLTALQMRSLTESSNVHSRISAREEIASLSNASHGSRSRRPVHDDSVSPALTDSETLLDDMDTHATRPRRAATPPASGWR